MPTIERFIAFRAFGDIRWPPVVDVPKPRSIPGVVEIYYVWDEQQGEYAACVRWTARTRFSEDITAPWPLFSQALAGIASVHGFADQELAAAYEGAADTELVYRFDKLKNDRSAGRRLRFEGITVLEQYSLPARQASDYAAPRYQLRLPLLASYLIDPRQDPAWSAVQIGQPDNPSLRLDLALALPAPASEAQRLHQSAVMAFSALYAPSLARLPATSTPLPFNFLVQATQNKEPFEPKPGWLGSFSFAAAGSQSSRYAVPPGVDWPTEATILKGILPTLGIRFGARRNVDLNRAFCERTDFESGSELVRMPSLMAGAGATPASTRGMPDTPSGFVLRQCYAIRTTAESGEAIDEDASDIRVRDRKFQVRAPGGEDQWLTLASTIYIVIETSGRVQDVWATDHTVTLQTNIGWRDDLAPLANLDDPLAAAPDMAGPAGGAGIVQLLAGAIASMRLARTDLRHLAPGQPQSFLPELIAADARDGERHFGLFACLPDGLLDAAGRFTFALNGPARRAIARASLQPDAVFEDPARAGRHNRLPLEARWPSFHHEAAQAKAERDLELLHDTLATAARQPDGMEERFVFLGVEDKSVAAGTFNASLGGMVFVRTGATVLDDTVLDEQSPNSLHFGARPALGLGTVTQRMLASANLQLRLLLAMNTVKPVAVDVSRTERAGSIRPLLLQENSPPTGSGAPAYLLAIDESLGPRQRWRLKAIVRERAAQRADVKTVMFSEQPFGVQRFWSSPLESLGDAGGTEVATYDSDDGLWELKRDGRSYLYVLPPQSVGESMDKPRRLELHDAPAAPPADGYLSPVPPGDLDGLQRYPVEFRLAPPAELWIQPSDVERNFFAPPWASASLFRQNGALGVGAALTALRAEFVYGLPVSISPKAERGSARRARVAEIEALTGRPMAPDSEGNGGRWMRLTQVLARRPERLELWADDPNSEIAFAPARFIDSARFVLRPTALHRPAVAAADLVRDGDLALAPQQRIGNQSPRLHPHGLSGGALWPIESHNVLNMVLDAPVANGGAIEQIALSPHGGDAEQDVKFCNRRVSIITSTRGGFVQRQKVEVLGRIAVFWHRAKHVVIYERTVNPSAQFTPKGGLKSRTRRPVLRKISEYIEILQPERRYPDMDGALPHTNCFLRGMRFNSIIIAVDSEWAEDVGQVGWKIPLWNRHAARVRPQVYPRPDTAFVTAAEGQESLPETAQECLNPDNLFFFADTTVDADDRTDLWKTRLAIDFTDLPAPCHDWPPRSDANDGAALGQAASARSPKRVPRGFARFTWTLAPSSQRTTVNAGRADQPVYAALESITFMRAGGGNAVSAPLAAVAGLKPDGIAPLFAQTWSKGEVPAGPDSVVTMAKLLNQASALMPADYPDEEKRKELRATLGELAVAVKAARDDEADLGARVGKIRDEYDKAMQGAAGLLDGLENQLPNYCNSMVGNLTAALGAKRLSMVQEVRAWEAETLEAIGKGPILGEFASESDLRNFLEAQMRGVLLPVFSAASVEVGKLKRGIETTRSAVADARAEIVAKIRGEVHKLQAVRNAIDLDKPWSDARMQQFGQRLDDIFRRADGAVASALADGRQRLASELDDLSQRVGTAAARALAEVDAGRSKLDAWAGLQGKIDSQLSGVQGQVTAWLAQPDDVFAKAKSALAKARTDHPQYDRDIAAIEAHIAQLESFKDTLEKRTAALVGALDNAGQRLTKEAAQTAAQLHKLAGAAGSTLHGMLAGLKAQLPAMEAVALDELRTALEQVRLPLDALLQTMLPALAEAGAWIDAAIAAAAAKLEQTAQECIDRIDAAGATIDEVAAHSLGLVAQAERALEPEALVETIVTAVLNDAQVGAIIQETLAAVEGVKEVDKWRAAARNALTILVDQLVTAIANTAALAADLLGPLQAACEELAGGIGQIRKQLTGTVDEILKPMRDKLDSYQKAVMDELDAALGDAAKYAGLVDKFGSFERDVRVMGNELASSADKAQAYGDRLIDAIGQIGAGGLAGAPGNILKAFAAAGEPPRMPNLDFAKERLAFYYGALNNVVDTTPVEAWFGRLAEGLGSMGLNAPCNRIGEWFQTMDLSQCEISKVIEKFAGCEFGKLLKGQKFARGLGDAIRITHEFNQKHARAWVRIDVNVPMDGRHPLFTVGPFSLDLVDARLSGHVRLEAAADSDKVEQTGSATITTGFDAVVGGQSMVLLNKVAIRYDKSGSLQVDFDPRNIKLNPTFQFIQNTLKSIVGDEVGGLKIVKRDGIPVGVEHLFSMPPISLVFGTSGVQNLQISNQFQLLAYPDFMLSNRFSLAKPDRPFIFSVFILGGTGWLTVDCEYRLFTDALLVVVEAGAGAAASLGFGFAGCTGSVAITISVALTYRKLIGRAGGGLTVSLVVLIVGIIDVLCIASAQLSLLLRLSYQDNGDIDATGTFSLTIRISRFFEVSAEGEARYAMHGGKTESSSSVRTDYKIKDEKLEQARKLIESQKG